MSLISNCSIIIIIIIIIIQSIHYIIIHSTSPQHSLYHHVDMTNTSWLSNFRSWQKTKLPYLVVQQDVVLEAEDALACLFTAGSTAEHISAGATKTILTHFSHSLLDISLWYSLLQAHAHLQTILLKGLEVAFTATKKDQSNNVPSVDQNLISLSNIMVLQFILQKEHTDFIFDGLCRYALDHISQVPAEDPQPNAMEKKAFCSCFSHIISNTFYSQDMLISLKRFMVKMHEMRDMVPDWDILRR